MSSLPNLFSELVHQIALERKDAKYLFRENKTNYTFKTPSNKAFGGRVEWHKMKMFGDSPPADVTKMCDAFFVISYKEKDFIVLVETKSGYKGDYRKQLDNGKRWCDWLLTLLKDHGYYHGQPIFVGLLVRAANPSQPVKPTTSKNRKHDKRESSKQGYGIYTFPADNNQPTIYLQEYLCHIKNSTLH